MVLNQAILEMHKEFINNPSQESYNAFKQAFIDYNSQELWDNCTKFLIELGGADLYDYAYISL